VVLAVLILVSFDAVHEGQLFNPLIHSYGCRIFASSDHIRYLLDTLKAVKCS
jgi:hypothetical protein